MRSLAVAAALLLGIATRAWAGPPWYQVEVLVFTQPGGTSPEHWPAIPDLAYPSPARFLVNPTRLTQARAEYGAAAQLDRFGRLVIDRGATLAATGAGGTADTSPEPREEPLPTAFAILPRAQLEFRDKAAYMSSRGGYRILFHEAWQQPVEGAQQALPVILDRSGDGGPWPELQGSIHLFLARYLHLETNLWLNTAGGYLPGEWRMPPPPVSPPSLVVLRPENASPTQAQAVESAAVASPLYPFRHAVLLQQKRRMRSNEIHYVDHPLFGMIVKITPLAEDDAQGQAAPAATP